MNDYCHELAIGSPMYFEADLVRDSTIATPVVDVVVAARRIGEEMSGLRDGVASQATTVKFEKLGHAYRYFDLSQFEHDIVPACKAVKLFVFKFH